MGPLKVALTQFLPVRRARRIPHLKDNASLTSTRVIQNRRHVLNVIIAHVNKMCFPETGLQGIANCFHYYRRKDSCSLQDFNFPPWQWGLLTARTEETVRSLPALPLHSSLTSFAIPSSVFHPAQVKEIFVVLQSGLPFQFPPLAEDTAKDRRIII